MTPEQKRTNRVLWDAVKITDPRETKQVKLPGGFQCTSVDFGYLQERATEVFGPAGLGYGWTFSFPPQSVGDLCVVSIRFWYKHPETGERGEYDVVASADAKIRRKEGGDLIDTDSFKKALTDAIKLGLKKVGFMADIYGGAFEEDGYKDRAVAYLDGQKKKELEALKAAPSVTTTLKDEPKDAPKDAPKDEPKDVPQEAVLTDAQRANVLFLRLKQLDPAKAEAQAAKGATDERTLAAIISNLLYEKVAKIVPADKLKSVIAGLPKGTDGKPNPIAGIGYLDGILGSKA